MPQRFFTTFDVTSNGLVAADIRGRQQRTLTETWPLPDAVTKVLRSLLQRTGFDPDLAIDVHELTGPPGFVFTR